MFRSDWASEQIQSISIRLAIRQGSTSIHVRYLYVHKMNPIRSALTYAVEREALALLTAVLFLEIRSAKLWPSSESKFKYGLPGSVQLCRRFVDVLSGGAEG